jgi:hypothetical protein
LIRLLLDAHLPLVVARDLGHAGIDAVAIRDWRGGSYLTAPDDQILSAAAGEDRVLVTYDLRTIPSLLKLWAETGVHHAGVILIDERTIRQYDVGSLVRSLETVVAEHGVEDWHDRVVFLRAAER